MNNNYYIITHKLDIKQRTHDSIKIQSGHLTLKKYHKTVMFINSQIEFNKIILSTIHYATK